jgi:hypothetical protein
MKKLLIISSLVTLSFYHSYAATTSTTTTQATTQTPIPTETTVKTLSQEAISKILTISLNSPIITQIPIRENGDSMINIKDYQNPRIKAIVEIPGYENFLATSIPTDLENMKRGDYNKIRKGLYDGLVKMLDFLPANIGIAFGFGYHTPGKVQEKFEYMLNNNKVLYPNPEDAFNKTAEMTGTKFNHSGIVTGGRAIITLFDINSNKILDLGKVGWNSNNISNEFLSLQATNQQKQNRNILAEAAAKAGLVLYGKNWSSLHYGDQVWAYMTGNQVALYGPVNAEDQSFVAKTKEELLSGEKAAAKEEAEAGDDD